MTKKPYKYKKHKNKGNKFIKSPIFNQMKNKQCHTVAKLIPLSHKYMSAHLPSLVQALH